MKRGQLGRRAPGATPLLLLGIGSSARTEGRGSPGLGAPPKMALVAANTTWSKMYSAAWGLILNGLTRVA